MPGARRSPPRAGRARRGAPLWCVHVVDAGPDRRRRRCRLRDRSRALHRTRALRARSGRARGATAPLSGTTGAVLDPIFALRARVRVNPGQAVSVAFTTLVATSREAAFALADRYHDSHAAQRALDLAWSATQDRTAELGITPTSAAVFQDLATQLLYQRRAPWRRRGTRCARNRGSQPRLWAQGISGDLPIVLATIDAAEGLPTLRELFDGASLLATARTDCRSRRRQRAARTATCRNCATASPRPDRGGRCRRWSISRVACSCGGATCSSPRTTSCCRRRRAMHIPCDGRSLTRILGRVAGRCRLSAGRERARPAPPPMQPGNVARVDRVRAASRWWPR